MRNFLLSMQVLSNTSNGNLDFNQNGFGAAASSRSANGQASEVLHADAEGSTRILGKQHLIAALLSEQFYFVSSKAQRKVPVPEGIRLDVPFDSTALKEFRKETQSMLSINSGAAAWSLVPGRRQPEVDLRGVNVDLRKEPSDVERGYNPSDEVKSRIMEPIVSKTSQSMDDKNGNLFYLRSQAFTADVAPLSQVLLETFEDHQKKTKRPKKTSKKSKVAVDLTELRPAGALSSDDEPDVKTSRKGRFASTSKQKVQVKINTTIVF